MSNDKLKAAQLSASANNKLFGRTTAGSGAGEEVTLDTDGTLAANSDTVVPTQKAVKTYADTKAPQGAATSSGLTMSTAKLLGRSTASTGAIEEITVGTGLTLSAGTLTASASGGGFWTADTATRTANTTFTVATDKTAIYSKGLVVRWTESATQRLGMVVSSSYGAPNTTVTIVGDTMASIDSSSFKYGMVGADGFREKFAVAGAIGAITTNVANSFYAYEPLRVLAADIQVGTAGTTNSTTVDINKGGTTMFTTKPTLATTVASSPTPFTADSATSLALGDKVTIDVDAIQATTAIDLYVQLYVYPTRLIALT